MVRRKNSNSLSNKRASGELPIDEARDLPQKLTKIRVTPVPFMPRFMNIPRRRNFIYHINKRDILFIDVSS